MITLDEGSGGWTIKVENGNQVTRLECTQYINRDQYGTKWFDLDRAMQDAEKIDNTSEVIDG